MTEAEQVQQQKLSTSVEPGPANARDSMDNQPVELVTWSCKPVFLYSPLPPATSFGHRAELWDVTKWLRELACKVVTAGDACFVRLFDLETGELFAEAPLPSDGSHLTRAVEPVVDSSRYFVLRVADRGDERKHAFVGLGFRERSEASAFTAVLDDYRIYLRRRSEAAAMRQAYSQGSPGSSSSLGRDSSAEPGERGTASQPLALAPGQTLNIKLKMGHSTGGTGPEESARRRSLDASGRSKMQRAYSLNENSPIAGHRLMPPPSATSSGGAQSPAVLSGEWAVFTELGSPPGRPSPSPASSSKMDEQDWGDFQ